MPYKTCPACNGSGNPSIAGVQKGSAQGCMTCNGSGSIYYTGTADEGGCFTGDTRVKTPNGWKTIRDFSTNDSVMSIDHKGLLQERKVIKVKRVEDCHVFEVLTTNGVINVTLGHAIQLSDGTWKRISQLKIGDRINFLNEDGGISQHDIISKRRKKMCVVYNLVVEEDFNFLVEGCIAHSFSYFKKIKSFYYTHLYSMMKSSSEETKHVINVG